MVRGPEEAQDGGGVSGGREEGAGRGSGGEVFGVRWGEGGRRWRGGEKQGGPEGTEGRGTGGGGGGRGEPELWRRRYGGWSLRRTPRASLEFPPPAPPQRVCTYHPPAPSALNQERRTLTPIFQIRTLGSQGSKGRIQSRVQGLDRGSGRSQRRGRALARSP